MTGLQPQGLGSLGSCGMCQARPLVWPRGAQEWLGFQGKGTGCCHDPRLACQLSAAVQWKCMSWACRCYERHIKVIASLALPAQYAYQSPTDFSWTLGAPGPTPSPIPSPPTGEG